MALDRRAFLVATLAPLAGCPTGGSPGTPTEDEPANTDSDSPGTPTEDEPDDPDDYLPEPGDGWRLEGRGDHDWHPIGGTDGTLGFYTGPDGDRYGVVVMFVDEVAAEGSARRWACAGWQIALALDGVAIAASTGTEQRTFTPERPPTMTTSPDPDRRDRVRALLSRSPRLTETDIDENRVECER